jgi:signal transduction histidine kinase
MLPRTGSRDELDRLAEVLNGMLERIRSQRLHIRRMSADIEPALRTPLTTLRGTLEIHLRCSDKEEERSLLLALEALDDTLKLLNRLWLLERLEASALAPQPHTPEGRRIGVTVRCSASTAELAVQDSGPGLRADQLERVFERFYSEREGGRGSGLGLTVARAIACVHQGTLTASSPGGTRFALRLPVRVATA